MNISANKIKKMWTVASVLGLSEETLRDIVEAVSGQRRISKLNNFQANQILDRLDDLFGQSAGIMVRDRMNPKEKSKILKLMYILGWNRYQLRGFIKNLTRKEHELELSRQEAYAVIEGLKAMHRKKEALAS